MLLRFTCCLLLLAALCSGLRAQSPYPVFPDSLRRDSIANNEYGFSIGAYMDAYYGYDFAKPTDNLHPYFVSSTHHNEFATNIMMLDVQVSHPLVRVWLRPAFGTYMAANYALAPAAFRNFTEAFAGVNLSPKRKRPIWLDAGIIFSPIAFENPYSRDQIMYLRSFTVENVPYYVTGLRLTAPVSDKLTCYVYVVNGWQQIADFNPYKSLLTQAEYRLSKRAILNWDTYIGREDSYLHPNYRMRYFSDLFLTYDIPDKFSLLVAAYAGIQRTTDPNNPNNRLNRGWQSANVAARYYFTPKVSISGRIEWFNDPHQIMVAAQNPQLSYFQMYGASLGFNYKISDFAQARIEGRSMYSDKPVFADQNQTYSKQNYFVVASITAWFTKRWHN